MNLAEATAVITVHDLWRHFGFEATGRNSAVTSRHRFPL